MSALIVCNCCGKKSLNPLFCCTKERICRECYQEVCRECLGSIQTCHKCYIRARPDAGSVEALKQLDGEELERIVKTLHLDPSRKSENEWITMIATLCGLPLKPIDPPPLEPKDQTPKMDFPLSKGPETLKAKKPTSVRTYVISNADPLKNRSSLHSQIIHEITQDERDDDDHGPRQTYDEEDDEVDEGIQADNSPKHTLSKTSPLSSPESDSEDDQWPQPSLPPPMEMSLNRNKSPPKPNTYTRQEVQSVETPRPPSWMNKNVVKQKSVQDEVEPEEEITEVDAKILRNIQQRRQLTPDEQRSLANFESKLRSWKSEGQIKSPVANGPKTSMWKSVDEMPIVGSNIRDIISQMNRGGQSTVNKRDNDVNVEIITNNAEKTIIEINPLPSVNKPEIRKNEPEIIFGKVEYRGSQQKAIQQLPEVHRAQTNWSKVALRETNQPKPWMTEAMNRQVVIGQSNQILNPAKLEMTVVPINQFPIRRDSNLSSKFATTESMAIRRDSNLAKLLMLDATFDQRNSNQISKSATEIAKSTTDKSSLANVQLSNRRDSNQIAKSTTDKSGLAIVQLSNRRDSNQIANAISQMSTFANVHGSNRRESNQILNSTTEVVKPTTGSSTFANTQLSNRRDSNQLPKNTREITQPATQMTVFATVHASNRRDSNQIKPTLINIVNKTPITVKNTSISIKSETLNDQSVDTLLTNVTNEKAIERMDVLQLRKLLRQLNVKDKAEMLFKRDELVEELRRLYRQADDIRNKGKPEKETIIIVSNRANSVPLQAPKATPGGVRVVSLRTFNDEEQIRNLNIFQLKSLLMEAGSDIADVNGKHELVEKAIEKWNSMRN